MSSINHEIFVTILKYCELVDLLKMVTISKECSKLIQRKIDSICELQGQPRWLKRFSRCFIQAVEISIGTVVSTNSIEKEYKICFELYNQIMEEYRKDQKPDC